jgi:hypothetical protein
MEVEEDDSAAKKPLRYSKFESVSDEEEDLDGKLSSNFSPSF